MADLKTIKHSIKIRTGSAIRIANQLGHTNFQHHLLFTRHLQLVDDVCRIDIQSQATAL